MTVLGPRGLKKLIQATSEYIGEVDNFRIIEFS